MVNKLLADCCGRKELKCNSFLEQEGQECSLTKHLSLMLECIVYMQGNHRRSVLNTSDKFLQVFSSRFLTLRSVSGYRALLSIKSHVR